MLKLTFPDKRIQEFSKGTNGFLIAESISKSLVKEAVAISVDGVQRDLCDTIDHDAEINIITKNSLEGLEIMRHTLAAQVLAKAIKNLFPTAQLAIGPTIKDGFYYDVLFDKPISTDDFPAIEDEMRKIISAGSEIKKTIKSKEEAINIFNSEHHFLVTSLAEPNSNPRAISLKYEITSKSYSFKLRLISSSSLQDRILNRRISL